MNIVLNLTLITTLGVGGFFDIRERRIPNWIVLFGVIGGVALGGIQGSTQLFFSIVGFALGIGALIIPFAFGWMGAGDVKFFAAIGALLGYKILPRVFFYSCIVAGVIALVAVALGQTRQISFKHFWVDCKYMFLSLPSGLPSSMRRDSDVYSVPWGVAIGAGTIMAYYFDPSGIWAGF